MHTQLDPIMDAISDQGIFILIILNVYIIDLTDKQHYTKAKLNRNDKTDQRAPKMNCISCDYFLLMCPSHHINVTRFDINVALFLVFILLMSVLYVF